MQEGLRYLYHYGLMKTEPTTLQQLLQSATDRLAACSDSPRLDAELLLCHALDKPRSYLFAHATDTIDTEAIAQLDAYLLRRLGREPVAYIIGRKEFWSLSLEVSPATLVPRPETELLVELAMAKLESMQAPRVADLGTGSGAIALALAHELPDGHFVATDKSEAALEVARRNAQRLGLDNIEFRHGDWTVPLAGESFDLIVSNPPYIREDDAALEALGQEPVTALTAGPAGLDDIRRLVHDCRRVLQPNGWLLLEHGADQAETVIALFEEAGWLEVGNVRDLAGRPRVTGGRNPANN